MNNTQIINYYQALHLNDNNNSNKNHVNCTAVMHIITIVKTI